MDIIIKLITITPHVVPQGMDHGPGEKNSFNAPSSPIKGGIL